MPVRSEIELPGSTDSIVGSPARNELLGIQVALPMRLHHLTSSLKYVEAAVRLESFERAALELNVTASAVSQQIAKVEAALGVTLFKRSSNKVLPSPAARSLAQSLGRAYEIIDDAMDAITVEHAAGPVRLVIYQTWATRWLIPRLPSLHALWPDVYVEFETGMDQADFVHKELDFAIRFEPAGHARIKKTRLFDQILIPVCAPQVAARIAGVADLEHVPLIASQNRLEDWPVWLATCGEGQSNFAPKLRFSNSTLAYEAAIAGAGVAIGQSHLLGTEIAAGQLVAPFGTGVYSGQSIYLLEPEGKRIRPAASAFRQWIISEAMRSHACPPWIQAVVRAPGEKKRDAV